MIDEIRVFAAPAGRWRAGRGKGQRRGTIFQSPPHAVPNLAHATVEIAEDDEVGALRLTRVDLCAEDRFLAGELAACLALPPIIKGASTPSVQILAGG